ncbi:uncharacterized protein LOC117191107 [Drosophila miranda]|uniref:uncharacterized protein LOC117191107 n=1 Tax=Drosophila miranda TaxID=7229 RepID=UPI00143F69C6|nr:uncharacterized protein LOC117191107 [Drosophila miranda]XP_033251962.1 uncharacterized protein LOC117191107 [Drosophila miranda]
MHTIWNITKRFGAKTPLRGHMDMFWLKLVCALYRDGTLNLAVPLGKYRQTTVKNYRDFSPIRVRNTYLGNNKNDMAFCNAYLQKLLQDYTHKREEQRKAQVRDTFKYKSSY